MGKPNLRLIAPATENRTVTPQRVPNAQLRTREHLTADEIEKLIEAAGRNRHGHRDALMVLLAFRHGLRAAEAVDLRWEQVDFKTASLHVRRAKNGTPATHPLSGREMRELRRHQRESPASPFVFVSERGAPLSAPGFSRMIERAASRPIWASRRMPTCCGTPAATSSPPMGTTRGRSRPTLDIAIFRIRRATRRWRRSGSRSFFGTDLRGQRYPVRARTNRPAKRALRNDANGVLGGAHRLLSVSEISSQSKPRKSGTKST
jgi:hypothetical protein